jgi:hypothetical protein
VLGKGILTRTGLRATTDPIGVSVRPIPLLEELGVGLAVRGAIASQSPSRYCRV